MFEYNVTGRKLDAIVDLGKKKLWLPCFWYRYTSMETVRKLSDNLAVGKKVVIAVLFRMKSINSL